MRPALLRLLKRPSALSVIDSLISSPLGIEQLQTQLRQRCLRCLSSAPQPLDHESSEPQPLKKGQQSDTTPRALSFPIHPILPPARTANVDDRTGLRNDEYTDWKELSLNLELLEYESDIGHTDDIGTRLVDDPVHRYDFGLWLELLRYRQRHYGNTGTLQIWQGLMSRVGGLQLPVDGENADVFWQSFVDLGLQNEPVLDQIADHASTLWEQSGKRWPKLYQSIVGSFVKRGMADQAVKWHKQLHNPHLSNPSDIADCFVSAVSGYDASKREPGGFRARMSAFREICKHTDGHQTYGRVIPALLASGQTKELLRMHQFLIERGDHPQDIEELRPLLSYTKWFSSQPTKERLRRYRDERFPLPDDKHDPDIPDTIEKSEGLYGGQELEGNQIKDDFGARIFATRALTFDMIVAGLKAFSVRAIGPQSLREMAKKAHGSRDVLDKLKKLEQNNISVGNSVFARLLRKLATEDRETLLDGLINSDQHHDVLEDPEIQASLLVSSYASFDWVQYNLSVLVLKELLGEGFNMLNLDAQKHIAAGETDLAFKAVTEMLIKGHSLDHETITFMFNYLFGPRKQGRRPVQQSNLQPPHTIEFVFRYLQETSLLGANMPVKLWIELLKRYGMRDRWHELRNCCLWLARRYSNDHPHPAGAIQDAGAKKLVLKKLFDYHMQEAIVSWGFIIQPPNKLRAKLKYEIETNQKPLVEFVRGILLLRELRNHGVEVEQATVRRVCRQRLVMLYGSPIFSNRPRNRALRRENPYIAERVVEDLNIAWGEEPLFDDEGKEWLRQLFRFHRPNLNRRHRFDRTRIRNRFRKRQSLYGT
ncbi:uncharacterized protein BDV17DRAFT_278437 [Aspergillus undulatus]|uniref:uncharacterized protein n=1 Tax=Aspergillus undulatus TaxID=1810928 RepID=UPI003CCE0FE6